MTAEIEQLASETQGWLNSFLGRFSSSRKKTSYSNQSKFRSNFSSVDSKSQSIKKLATKTLE
jgi:hypothetical protein